MRHRWGALSALLFLAAPVRAEEARDRNRPEDPLRLEVHGDFRARYHSLHDIHTDGDGGGITLDVEDANFLTQRLRLEPAVVYGPDQDAPIGALRMQVDALEDVVWGDNAGLTTPALFASDLSSTGRGGSERPTLELKRAWLELMVPVGRLQVGRMGSHWGMGLLANGGDGYDDDFGDNRSASNVDRILFATRPVSVARAVLGRPPGEHPLVFAFAYDQLVEDPVEPDDPPRAPYGGWVADGADDVDEIVFVLLWKDDELHRWRSADQLHAGVYYVNRSQDSTNSSIHIVDVYGRLRWGPWFGVVEGYQILGSSQAIPLPAPAPGELPDRKSAEIIGWAARGGYERPLFTIQAEMGHASGDRRVDDETFTARPLHPAHHVGLVLFQEVLAEVTATRWGVDARGFWSQGGVYNTTYAVLTGKLRPLSGLELVLAGLYAVPDEVDGSIVVNDEPYGFEVDGAAKLRFQEHFDFSLEGGVLFPGQALWADYEWCDGPASATCGGRGVGRGPAWSVQARLAMVF